MIMLPMPMRHAESPHAVGLSVGPSCPTPAAPHARNEDAGMLTMGCRVPTRDAMAVPPAAAQAKADQPKASSGPSQPSPQSFRDVVSLVFCVCSDGASNS